MSNQQQAGRVGDWIQTYKGIEFYPLDPRPEEVDIEDIAHALSNICRFTGHSRKFYSVAEHSFLVSQVCDPADALWGLLHDASEAYICDLARPIKKHSTLGAIYEETENAIMAAICRKFGLDLVQPVSVERADKGMLYAEYRDLITVRKPGWEKWSVYLTGKEPAWMPCWTPGAAKERFLHRFWEIVGFPVGAAKEGA